jgi:mannose-6-phosphate isomerase-like protein (cupin superfamily)
MERADTMGKINQSFGRQDMPKPLASAPKIDKYWGWIKTVYADENFTLKIVKMNAGTQSSMEYHVIKSEFYYIAKGKLKLGLRIGRAKNKSLILSEGDVYHIPPGLMHMRIAIEDTEIIEWSNKDEDTDSNIVEDGLTYIFKESE